MEKSCIFLYIAYMSFLVVAKIKYKDPGCIAALDMISALAAMVCLCVVCRSFSLLWLQIPAVMGLGVLLVVLGLMHKSSGGENQQTQSSY